MIFVMSLPPVSLPGAGDTMTPAGDVVAIAEVDVAAMSADGVVSASVTAQRNVAEDVGVTRFGTDTVTVSTLAPA